MKKIYTLLSALFIVFAVQAQTVTVSVGAQYANDVFYSFENGTVSTVSKSNWDIGFNTNSFSVSIIANNSSGVEVFTYTAGDTAAWSTLDTTGMTWMNMYNSIETWENGALARNQLGHPDYGWGIYNMGNHHIMGDSLFVIKTVSGDYKKLWIVEKNAVGNIWKFKYANLDGSSEQVITVNAGMYDTKNFIYYSIDNNMVQDREPASDTWDLLFTKYYDYTIPYNVTGVLANEAHVLIEEVSQAGLNQATFNTYTEANFITDIHTVGSEWKEFNMSTMGYDVSDSTVFFSKSYNSNGDSIYHKFYFTNFTGSSVGDYIFNQSLLLHTDIDSPSASNDMEVYPNPTQQNLTIDLGENEDTYISLFDLQGKLVYSVKADKGQVQIPMDKMDNGVYFLNVKNAQTTYTEKIIKQ